MSENISEILNACAQLKADKKPITIALVKSKLSRPFPLASIVSGIQRFKSATSVNEVNALLDEARQQDEGNQEFDLSLDTFKTMQDQIATLKNQVKALQAEVAALKSK